MQRNSYLTNGMLHMFFIMVMLLLTVPSFSQIDVISKDDAKKTMDLKLTSFDKDKIINKKLIHLSDKSCENSLEMLPIYYFNTLPENIRVYCINKDSSKKYICINDSLNLIDMKPLPNGAYTITGKIMFAEQFDKYMLNVIGRKEIDKNNKDSLVLKASIEKELKSADINLKKDDFLQSDREGDRFILILNDDKGIEYLVLQNNYFSEKDYVPNPEFISISCYEKLKKAIVGQKIRVGSFQGKDEEYFRDLITGNLLPIPKPDQILTGEKIALVNDTVVGVFSDGSNRFTMPLKNITDVFFDRWGQELADAREGENYFYSIAENPESEEDRIVLRRYTDGEKINNKYYRPYFTNWYIQTEPITSSHISTVTLYPIKWDNERKVILGKIAAAQNKDQREAEKEVEREIRAAEQRNLTKYGTVLGTAINKGQVKLAMNKSMVSAAWGCPIDRYTCLVKNVRTDIWTYTNAILSFVNGKLVKIERFR